MLCIHLAKNPIQFIFYMHGSHIRGFNWLQREIVSVLNSYRHFSYHSFLKKIEQLFAKLSTVSGTAWNRKTV